MRTKTYCIHYHDDRLTLPYQAIDVETINIIKWVNQFITSGEGHITLMEYEEI